MAGFPSKLYSLFSECSKTLLADIARRSFCYTVLLTLLLSALSARFHAQTLPPTMADDQAGEQAYTSYHGGDIDSIGLSNGTLSLNLPFLSYPQRGKLHVSFNLMYHNSQQHQGYLCVTVGGRQTCTWTWGYGGQCCVLGVTWAQNLQLHGQSISKLTGTGNQAETWYYSNFALQMPDGSRHPLGNLGTISWTPTNSPCTEGNIVTCEIQSGPFETLDATGWRVNGSLEACATQTISLGCYVTPSQVIDPDGVIYGNGTLQDPNGNEVTSNTTTITDSLGRQIPLPPTVNSTQVPPTNCPVVQYPPGVASISASYALLWTPPGYNGSTAQYTFCYANIPTTINYFVNTPTLLQSIVLPNGQSWQFQYYDSDGTNNFASLSQITLPTGGTISYTYGYGGQYHGSLLQDYGRWVATRTVNANDGSGSHTWTYTYNNPDLVSGTTTVSDPLGNDVVHTFGFGNQYATYETQAQYYQGSHSSGTLLKTVNTNYSSLNDYWQSNAPLSVVPTSIGTVWPNGTSQVTKTYDPGFSFTDYLGNTGKPGIYGKVVTEQAYDYPSGSSLLRTTNTSYAWQSPNPNYSTYLTNNLVNLPYSVQVKDGGGTQRAYTTYGYDESGLQSSGVIEQKVTGESYPGNQTSVHRWLNGSTTATTNCNVSVSNGYLVSNKVYYDTGEVQQSKDPCVYPTTYQYSSTYYGAFLTTATNALNQNTTYAYDLNTGVVTSITDPNSQTTNKNYDILSRLISVSFPDGGSTTLCYTDMGGGTCSQSGAPYQVVVTKAITSSPVLNETSTIVFDGLGRTSQTQLNSDPSGTTYTETVYDANGRKSQVYNPTRCSSITTNCNNETTWGLTTTNYDGLGRVTSVVEQDGSTVSTNYSAFPCTTVTDEVGNSRQSCVDGLGRMTSVLEDPGSSPHLNYTTNYTYDALGNLTYVNQIGSSGGQPRTRTFQYDSLSQLTSAQNPESGTILYAYDADGNVITKTAPLPNQTGTATVTTTNTYDTLNRVIKKGYMDGNNPDPYTPTVQFGYDGVAIPSGCSISPPGDTDGLPVGRQTAMCDGSGATSWTHDSMGRVRQERRAIGAQGVNHYVDYTYNLDGSLRILQTPPMKQLNYTYNGAGKPTQLVDSTDSINFALSGTYAPPGQLTGVTLGSATGFNGFTVTNAYNDRLQPILLSAASPTATVFSECFDFHLGVAITLPSPCSFSRSTAGDNGNVYQIVNNRTSNRTQSFTYDTLNRISAAQSSGSQWGETFTIDAWGNLTNRTGISGKTYYEPLACPANSNNQLTTCSIGYDAAGNMTSNGSTSYVYDAENRLVWTSSYRYVYDGKGERVEKCQAASATTACPTSGTTGTLYWRGTGSDTLAETDLAGNDEEEYIFFNGQRIARRDTTSTGTTIAIHYYFSDHLGSHGVVENATGTTCEQDIDYYPYGGVENDYCSGSGVAQNYKFNGKERDGESGLDNFGARYDSSALGRFMTPDWAAKPVTVPYAKFGDPQSLNLYSYVENGPVNRIDPDGHEGEGGGGDGGDSGGQTTEKPGGTATTPAAEPQQKAQNQVTILGNAVAVTYANGMSDKDRQSAFGAVSSAAGLLNSNAAKLSDAERASIANIKTIDVDPKASRSSVDVKTGTFHANAGQLGEGTARFATDIAHDSFHITQWKAGLAYTGGPAEHDATYFQIGVGGKIGLSQGEINGLKSYADHIENYKNYWNSPVTHPPDQ
jgi:RHS repeat-associated protein